MSTSYDEQRQRQDSEQRWPSTQKGYGHSTLTPTTRQTVKFLTATTLGTVLLILSGLILTGTILSLILATPVLVLFSPVLLPAALAVFLLASGFVFSGTCGVVALSALAWIYQYSTGHRPPGSQLLNRGRFRTSGGATSDVHKEKSSYY